MLLLYFTSCPRIF